MVDERIAIIPARGGSKRLPKKNILEFHGKPMIAWTIQAALESKLFDTVLVSTDSEEIAEIAINFGAEVPFLRNKNCNDYSPVSAATITALNQLFEYNGKSYEVVVQLMPNCPLRSAYDIRRQLSFFETQKEKHSVISAFKYGMFNPWWAHYKDSEGNFIKLITDRNVMINSQELPELYCPSGAIWISEISRLLESHSFYSPGYQLFYSPWENLIDIDDSDDLHLANIILSANINKNIL